MPGRDVSPRKILVLRFSSLGDIIMTTAAIRCLRTRFPDAQIDMLVRQDFVDLIRFNPHLNRAWAFPRQGGWRGLIRLTQEIRAQEYDLIYDAHRSLRTRLLLPFLRGPQKRYFQKQYLRRSLALLFKLPLLDGRRFLERFVSPLSDYGVVYDKGGPEIFFDPASRSRAMEKAGLRDDGRPRIGIIPSAQWPGKRWPVERFDQVVRQLVQTTPYEILVFGGPRDHFCSAIGADLNSRVVNVQGKLSLLESVALVKACRFVIANDTGLMHVADALQVPVVLIFGPTSADLGCLPHHPSSRVVERTLWCRPCSKNGQAPCIRGRRVCLEGIGAQEVFEQAMRLHRSMQ